METDRTELCEVKKSHQHLTPLLDVREESCMAEDRKVSQSRSDKCPLEEDETFVAWMMRSQVGQCSWAVDLT